VREPRDRILNSEDVVLSSVGRDLCEKFFAGYTRKQWGLDLAQLSAGVAARIPTRTNDDDRYFTDTFQAMPAQGYTAMFRKILDHSRIRTILGTDFEEVRGKIDADFIVYTGPLDAYFGHCFGKLPYRSLRFEHEHFPEIERMQAVGTVNYPNTHAYTRITEFKHLTGQTHSGTSIVREFPCSDGDPYYPVPRPENEQLFKRYLELADRESDVHFIGRLAQYRYYNMDQVVASAIALSEKLVSRYLQPAGLAIEAEIA
jgi:UDP-galactopyranose mutase